MHNCGPERDPRATLLGPTLHFFHAPSKGTPSSAGLACGTETTRAYAACTQVTPGGIHTARAPGQLGVSMAPPKSRGQVGRDAVLLLLQLSAKEPQQCDLGRAGDLSRRFSKEAHGFSEARKDARRPWSPGTCESMRHPLTPVRRAVISE